MKKNSLAFLFILITCVGWSQTALPVATDNPLKRRMDSLVQETIGAFMHDSTRVGLSAGIYINGQSYTYNYGTTVKGKHQLPTAHTMYEIASITKTFTATLLARAITGGKVKAEEDIRRFLPGSYPNLSYDGHPVQLLHLTNLTSGLPNWLPESNALFARANPDSIPFLLADIHKKYSREQFYADLHHVQLDTVPGTNPRHSNVAAQLLGYILEKIYNAPFSTLLDTFFTRPLGMQHTCILASVAGNPLLAKGYDHKGRIMPYIDWADVQVSGGINSTAADMLRYIQYQLDEKNDAVRLTHQVTYGTMGKGEAIGFNWHIDKTARGFRQLSHTGGSLGFSSYIVLYPDQQTGIVLLSNESDGGAQQALAAAADSLFNRIVQNK